MELPAGIHDITAAAYHADPCADPSLSASVAHLLCSRSPRHAWAAHPRLNPDFERTERAMFDIGTVAHSALLLGEASCYVVDAPNWQTKAAKEERDRARELGLTPLLTHQAEEINAMVAAVRPQLEAFDADPPLLTDGKPEQTLIWEEDGVTLRARADWLRDDFSAIDDLKTTSGSGHPQDWTHRRLWDIGADIQAAFYMRGLRALAGTEPEFRFCVVESSPPYAVSVIGLAPSALELANEKVDHAIAKWRECMERDEWPAYMGRVAYAETPAWQEAQWMEARFQEQAVAA